MSTTILTQANEAMLLSMSEIEVKNTIGQMTALMNAIANEKASIDSMTLAMEKQPWYKKMIFTLLGKNRATVSEIQKKKDLITGYTAEALAVFVANNKVQQDQITSLWNSVNHVNSTLAQTQYEMLKAMESFSNFKNEIIGALEGLAGKLDEKIISIDNYNKLIQKIDKGLFDCNNSVASIIIVISQLDKRMVEDPDKLAIIRVSLRDRGYFSKNVYLKDILQMVAEVPEEYIGLIYNEFSCLDTYPLALFGELMEKYSLLPTTNRKMINQASLIENIAEAHDIMLDAFISLEELFDVLLNEKKCFLSEIHDSALINIDEGNEKSNIINYNDTPAWLQGLDGKSLLMNKHIEDRICNDHLELAVGAYPLYLRQEIFQRNDLVTTFSRSVCILPKGKSLLFLDLSVHNDGSLGLLITTHGFGYKDENTDFVLYYQDFEKILDVRRMTPQGPIYGIGFQCSNTKMMPVINDSHIQVKSLAQILYILKKIYEQ